MRDLTIDPTRCKQTMSTGPRGLYLKQCSRKRTHGEYCAQHDPAAADRRLKKSNLEGSIKFAQESMARYAGILAPLLIDLVQGKRDVADMTQNERRTFAAVLDRKEDIKRYETELSQLEDK